MSKV
jgi:hypothetical protein